MPHRTLSLQEVSDLLHISPGDVKSLVKYDEIPHFRHGDRLVFSKTEIDAWASQQLLGSTDKELARFHRNSSAAKLHDLSEGNAILAELLHRDCVAPELQARTKNSVLRGMVALAENSGYLYDPADLLQTLIDREEMRSTALGRGVALLHPRHHDPYLFADSFIAFGRTFSPIPFGAPDGENTDLFFLVCCQADNIHLHVLARLSMACVETDLLDRLGEAETSMDMIDAIVECEEAVTRKL